MGLVYLNVMHHIVPPYLEFYFIRKEKQLALDLGISEVSNDDNMMLSPHRKDVGVPTSRAMRIYIRGFSRECVPRTLWFVDVDVTRRNQRTPLDRRRHLHHAGADGKRRTKQGSTILPQLSTIVTTKVTGPLAPDEGSYTCMPCLDCTHVPFFVVHGRSPAERKKKKKPQRRSTTTTTSYVLMTKNIVVSR